jgi:penicillin-binding protein 2
MAHVVGYVGPVSDYDLKKRNDKDPLLQIPKFQIGKTGVERRSDLNLRGEAGISRIEVNSVGRVMRELDKTKARPGENLQLTVDNDLQNYALRRIEGQSASAVVMDVYNGDIMALASAPSFDPNKFVLGISTQDWNGLLENKYRPLSNKAASGAYPPGSTFKMVVVLAALEEGLITPSEKIYCPGHYLLGEQRYHCWSRGGHGDINLRDGLKKSCDVYYYDVARRVGIEKITEMARRLGLGYKHDLPLPAVTAGLTPTKDWKRRKYDKAWLIGDTLNAGIGQGYMLASPLHLATMTARLASGLEVVPRLIRATGNRPLPDPAMTSMGLSENALGLVRRAMYSVVNEKRGTAYSNRIVDPRYTMAGKTGTSQVRRITKEERAKGVYRNEDLPWERRDHALFVAYAPYDAPRYAISVVVEHGGAGSKYAAPIARDILLQALHGGTPPLSAYPKAQRNKIRAQRDQMPPAPPDIPFNVSERA